MFLSRHVKIYAINLKMLCKSTKNVKIDQSLHQNQQSTSIDDCLNLINIDTNTKNEILNAHIDELNDFLFEQIIFTAHCVISD